MLAMISSGCAQFIEHKGFDEVQQIVDETIDAKIHWKTGDERDLTIINTINNLLTQQLTAEYAVQIALLNNPELQVEYENLGVAQADLVQASLLSNPVLFSSIRFPEGGDGGNNVEFGLEQSFLDILLLPSRKRIAEKEFVRTKLRLAKHILDMAADVLSAFYRLQGAMKQVEVTEVASESAQLSLEIAQRFDEAGNLSELELAQHRSAAASARVKSMQAKYQLQTVTNEFNLLLGITQEQPTWATVTELGSLPHSEINLSQALNSANQYRLDLRESEHEMEQLRQSLAMTRSTRWIGGADIGVSTEREPDGARVTGPNFSLEVPIFDQGQAKVARMESLLNQSEARHAVLRVEIEAEVNAAINQLTAARKLTEFYRDELLPAREQVVTFTQQEQNYMLLDVFELLLVRQQQAEAYQGYVESLTDYWIARAQLAKAVGTGLPLIDQSPADKTEQSLKQMPDATKHQMHH